MQLDKAMAEILGIIHLLEDPVAMEAYAREELRKRRARTAARNARFAATLTLATDIQVAKIDALETSGMTVSKLWRSRRTGNIAVMLEKPNVWDDRKMKMGCKLTIVYPDGRNQTEFGKVPLHEEWI